jgi:tetratricopeptide (TPR) repeat protein
MTTECMCQYSHHRNQKQSVACRRALPALAAGLMLLGAAGGRAWAQDAAPADEEADLAPWEQGVTPEQENAADELVAEGNRLIKIPLFAQAAAKYREALTHWDHPALHYNLGIAQLNLVQPLEAYRSFETSLRHGPEPLGQEKYDQAKEYLKTLEQRLARIEVVCQVPGAEVLLDGEPLFIGPGTREELVSPGRHQLVASKAEHVPDTRQIAVSAGERVRHVLAPRSMDEVARRERPWAVWKPWAAAAAGAGLIAGAGYLDWSSSQDFDRFDQGFESNMDCVRYGCRWDEIRELAEQREAARTRQRAAMGLYAVGGAALGAGAVLMYFNRERLVHRGEERISIDPVLGPDSAGVSARFSFFSF